MVRLKKGSHFLRKDMQHTDDFIIFPDTKGAQHGKRAMETEYFFAPKGCLFDRKRMQFETGGAWSGNLVMAPAL